MWRACALTPCQASARASSSALGAGSGPLPTDMTTTRAALWRKGSALATARAACGLAFQASSTASPSAAGAAGGASSRGRPVSRSAACTVS